MDLVRRMLFLAIILLCCVAILWQRQRQNYFLMEESELNYLDHLTTYRGPAADEKNIDGKSIKTPPLIYIPTREGLASRFGQLEVMHSNALSVKRNLIVLDNYSVHYKDLGKISLCDIILLPSTIKCSSASIEKVIQSFHCTMPPVPLEKHKQDLKWLFKPSNFGLKTLKDVNKLETFTWNKTLCTLAFGYFFSVRDSSHRIPIQFTPRYVNLFRTAFDNLQRSSNSPLSNMHPALQRPIVIAVHWRRGDQNDRCQRGEDTSVNCRPVEAFINQVRTQASLYLSSPQYLSLASSQSRPLLTSSPLIYVATNERDAAVLRNLEAAGFKLLKHTRSRDEVGGRMDSLSSFVVELQIMIEADHFIRWGVSGVGDFVERARKERLEVKKGAKHAGVTLT